MKRGIFFALLPFLAAMTATSSYAAFQNWQSDVFEEKPRGNNAFSERRGDKGRAHQEKEEDRRLRSKLKSSTKEGSAAEERLDEEENYYEAIAPKDMERDHNYLLENHPLQEDPLPDKGVE